MERKSLLEVVNNIPDSGSIIQRTGIENILSERGTRYGDFSDHAHIAQCLKFVMHETPKWSELSADKKEALDMIQHKIARILNGDPEYMDSWTDIIGYTQLVIDRLKGNEK